MYRQVKNQEDFTILEPRPDELIRVVVFFDDYIIETMAEKLKLEARVKNFNCKVPFEKAAKELFYPFNARIH